MYRSLLAGRNRTWVRGPVLAALAVAWISGCARPGTTYQDDAPAPEEDRRRPSTISGEVHPRPNEPIASVLQSRFPGVSVAVNPDGSLVVRIRGASSFYASTEPLYVVDGTPIRPGPRGGLIGVNPHDIESIKVLKHPPETSLYGVRGANGVVVITTRRP